MKNFVNRNRMLAVALGLIATGLTLQQTLKARTVIVPYVPSAIKEKAQYYVTLYNKYKAIEVTSNFDILVKETWMNEIQEKMRGLLQGPTNSTLISQAESIGVTR